MATPQPFYRIAWCLHIASTPDIYAATTDLPEAAAVTTLGAFYTKRIKNADAVLTESLPNLFYGLTESQAIVFRLDNSDLALSAATDWRLVSVTLTHYDRTTDTATTDFTGLILAASFVGTEVEITIGSFNASLFQELLPAAVIDATGSGPFAQTDSPGEPVPVVFGADVPVVPPSAYSDAVSDPAGYDFLVGHGGVNRISAVYQDYDPNTPGLERLGEWSTAPGTPTYVSTTRFSVTNDQRVRYFAGQAIRFKTTASGSTFLYSTVAAYDDVPAPDQVQVQEALLDSGLNSVEIAGDYLILYSYSSVTDGLLPVPGAGVPLTALRLFDQGDGHVLATVSNVNFPPSTTDISDVVSEILTNTTWGLSVRQAQAVHASSFSATATALAGVGLTGAVNGALAYDQQQRQASNVLNELLMMRGMRLWQDSTPEWRISADTTNPSISKTFNLGPGASSAIPIMRILQHGRMPVDQAVSRVVLHWSVLGRQRGNARFEPHDYARMSWKTVNANVGSDLHVFSPWIRDATTAGLVTHYLAEKFEGADERLVFTAGPEARDTALGDAITVTAASDGVSGNWQVYGTQKRLNDITISCIRLNADAYGAPSGVTHNTATTPTEHRTATNGGGTNIIKNPRFGPPYQRTTASLFQTPADWAYSTSSFTSIAVDYSATVVAQTISGHYIKLVVPANDEPPSTSATYAVRHDAAIKYSVQPSTKYIPSIYCDRAEGLFLVVEYWTEADFFLGSRVLELIRDTGDTNPAGWTRFYSRFTTPDTAYKLTMDFAFSRADTYQIEAPQIEVVERTARKPSPWRQHKQPDLTSTATTEITFNGSSTYTATSLIPAGVKVIGVSSRVTQAITFGTATAYDIGTAGDQFLWGAAITNVALDDTTGPEDFETRNEIYFPTATNVVVTGNGTITSGKLKLVLEYSRPAPPSGT